jgi:hypothetical protein
MLEMRVQIDALREAFSADTSKPFELKANFPLGSPTPQPDDTPTVSHASYAIAPTQDMANANVAASQVNYNIIHPITPPISAGSEDDHESASPARQNLGIMQNQDQSSHGSDGTMQSQGHAEQQWNPTRLFE